MLDARQEFLLNVENAIWLSASPALLLSTNSETVTYLQKKKHLNIDRT